MREKIQVLRNIAKYQRHKNVRFESVDSLVTNHFDMWSNPSHQNVENLRIALNLLGGESATIVETGTSAYGTDSSRLFNSYIENYGGLFYSIDIRKQAKKNLVFQHSQNSKFLTGDSVQLLGELSRSNEISSVDLVYLDSWDVDWADPNQCAKHGLEEFRLVKPFLKKGSILVIDDTPNSLKWIPSEFHEIALNYERENGVLPGKGALVVKELESDPGSQKIWHEYNCVYLFG